MVTTTYNVFGTKTEGDITISAGSTYTIAELTQAEYNALTTKDANTLYIITEATT